MVRVAAGIGLGLLIAGAYAVFAGAEEISPPSEHASDPAYIDFLDEEPVIGHSGMAAGLAGFSGSEVPSFVQPQTVTPAPKPVGGTPGEPSYAALPLRGGTSMIPPAPSADMAGVYVHAEIHGILDISGFVAASLCEKHAFTKSGCRTMRVPAREGRVSVTFDNVPPGLYAIQVMHDVNGNHEMDFGFFGVPKEPFGFSRDVEPQLSAPDFEDACFLVEDLDVSLVIRLQNT